MEVPLDPGIEVRTYFARGRNALVARAEFSQLYAALYLHQMDCGIRLGEAEDQLLRDALAAMTLHCASRPRTETAAWTVNFQSPLANVFVSGDNKLGTVVGNVFTENVKRAERNLFYADVVAEGRPPRRSVVEFSGDGFLDAVGEYYRQSEQRPARVFPFDEEDLVLIAAQPDCDLPWFDSLTEKSIRNLDREVELGLLEQRRYRFECGCNHHRILAMLAPVMRKQPEELFQNEETLKVQCPRCGARHGVTREALEAYISTPPSGHEFS